MFVIYVSDSENEILVTTKKKEKKMVKEWFGRETGRKRKHYDILECQDLAVSIGSSFCSNGKFRE